jgi:sporulation protein YqfC
MKKKKKYIKNKPPKHNVERYKDGLRQIILDQKLPAEAILKETLLTMVGCSELWVENYKALLGYSEGAILIQTDKYMIRIEGERLWISHYMEEHMMICGNIRSITYLQ